MPIIGIAKRLEEIYFPGDQYPIHLDKKSESLMLLQRIRDEAHRFAITFHRQVRSKKALNSQLTDIEGIGALTAEKLLKEFVAQNLSLFEDYTQSSFEQILSLESNSGFDIFVDSLIPFFSTRTNLLNQFLKLKFDELMLHLLDLDRSNQFRITLFNIYQGQKVDLSFFLENYYLKPLSINELARISGRSLSAFKRDFELKFNTSPAVWIKNKRLEYAFFLLQNSQKNVSEISLEIGYESVSHFIKAFKEKYGFTPNKII
jgi:AraC-like DNA-binding protein